MTEKEPRSSEASDLRRRAEAFGREKDTRSREHLEPPSPEEARQTLHKLRVHQIELGLQNEELRQAQAELEDSQARHFDLYDLAPVGYCTLSEKGLILEANLTVATLLGVARGEMVTQPISRFILPEDRTADLIAANRALKSEAAQRKQMEDELRVRRAQLAHASRLTAVGGLAAGLAHESNQPLAAAQNYALCGLERIRAGVPQFDELREDLEKVMLQVGRAGKIIRHIRQFIRRRDPHRSTTDVNEAVRHAILLTRDEIASRGIRLETHLADPLPSILVDHIEIERVLVNLIQNEMEAMENGGVGDAVLTVTTTVIPDGSVQAAVSDSGPGVTPEMRERLFTPFLPTKEGGLGLGLCISRDIIESHGGQLWAVSNPKGGTTFTFSLYPQGAAT